jgi:NADPH-dependent curcumin reductase CurA
MKGFVVYEFFDMREQFLADMRQWIAEGKMKYQETIMQGVENAPNAMIGLLQGENSGKMLVQIGPETE